MAWARWIAAHPVVGLEMAGDWFDSRSPNHLAPDGVGHAAFLARCVDLEAVAQLDVVALVAGTGENPREGRADVGLDGRCYCPNNPPSFGGRASPVSAS